MVGPREPFLIGILLLLISSEGLSTARNGQQKCIHWFKRALEQQRCWSRLLRTTLLQPGEPRPPPQLPMEEPAWDHHRSSPRWASLVPSTGLEEPWGGYRVVSPRGSVPGGFWLLCTFSAARPAQKPLAWTLRLEVPEQAQHQQCSLLKIHQQDLDRRDISHKFISPPLNKLHLRVWDPMPPLLPYFVL